MLDFVECRSKDMTGVVVRGGEGWFGGVGGVSISISISIAIEVVFKERKPVIMMIMIMIMTMMMVILSFCALGV